MKKQKIQHHFWKPCTVEQIAVFNANPPRLAEILGSIELVMTEILMTAELAFVWHGPYTPVDLVLRSQLEELNV